MTRRYLVVDDDQTVCLFLAAILGDRGQCARASNADEALDLFSTALSSEPFDAVFMDIMMPGMDGHQIVERMRGLEQEAGVPDKRAFVLIMISALDDADNVALAYHHNQARGYLIKPFSREQVLEELRRAGLES